jgi:hypothetical protein
MRGVTPAFSARRRRLHRRLVESEEPTQHLPTLRRGATIYERCRIRLRV